jgi:hypothetical protein
VRPDVQQIVDEAGVRLVLARLERGSFDMEMIGRDLWIRVPDTMPEPEAAAHLRTQWYCWHSRGSGQAQLWPGEQSGVFLEGLVYREAETVDAAVCLAEALAIERRTNAAAEQMSADILRRGISEMAAQPRIDPNSVALVMNAAQMAAHLAVMPDSARDPAVAPLQATQPDMHRLVLAWAKTMSDRDLSDPHSRCGVLRRIHADALWGDTILVACPIERIAYGSRAWPIDQAPLRRG